MKAIILAIGDELVFGQTVDTNSAWLSRELADRGIGTVYHKTVADDVDAIAEAFRIASVEAGLVVATGGLGPTADDLTREALSKLTGKPLDLHPPSLEKIRGFFRKLGREMPATNRCQAMFPRGSEVLDNDWGTAPGIKVRYDKTVIFSFPGVPREMTAMFNRHVVPFVSRIGSLAILAEAIHTFGAGESVVAEKIADLMKRERNPRVGTTVSGGVVSVRIRSEFPTADQARKHLDKTAGEVRTRLGNLVFGAGEDTLQGVVGSVLKERRRRVVTAESCTGGLVAKILTDQPGSSEYVLGGWIAYSNETKQRELGVAAELIAQFGAVSSEVAEGMAAVALKKSGADYALALTGIAGPLGGSEDKPVGTVWICLGSAVSGVTFFKTERFMFPGDRETIRDRAAKTALNMLRLELAAS